VLIYAVFRRIQHISNKNPVPTGGRIDKNVRHGTNQLTVLDNGTAAH